MTNDIFAPTDEQLDARLFDMGLDAWTNRMQMAHEGDSCGRCWLPDDDSDRRCRCCAPTLEDARAELEREWRAAHPRPVRESDDDIPF